MYCKLNARTDVLLNVGRNVILVTAHRHFAIFPSMVVLVELGLEQLFDLLTSDVESELFPELA